MHTYTYIYKYIHIYYTHIYYTHTHIYRVSLKCIHTLWIITKAMVRQHRPDTQVAEWDIDRYVTVTSLKRARRMESTLSCHWGLLCHPTQVLSSCCVLNHFIYFTAIDKWCRDFGPGSACFVAVMLQSFPLGRFFVAQLGRNGMPLLGLEQLVFGYGKLWTDTNPASRCLLWNLMYSRKKC